MNILYIEDEAIPQRMVQRAARHTGDQVLSAMTCAEGYKLAHQPIDLILLDLNLPDGNGLDLAKQLRAEQVMTPIIVVTGDVFGCNREIALAAGCTDFRAKPLFVEDLEALFTQYAAR